MRIIAVMAQKGGIGKTMTAASIAYILGEEFGFRILGVDADQQGNLSQLYGRYEPDGTGMSELLEHHAAVGGQFRTTDLIRTTPYKQIDIIPANGYLMRTNMNLLLKETEDQIARFSAAMIEIAPAYDFVIVDCGLLMDMTVVNVLAAADLVIIPAKIGGFEIEAIDNTCDQINDLRGLNPDVRTKILMTMRQRNKTSLEVEEWLHSGSGRECFRTAIRRSVIAEKSTLARLPLPKFSKNGVVTRDYRDVSMEIVEMYRREKRENDD